MAWLALSLVLASAVLHAAWNALLKKASNPEAVATGILAVSLGVTACAAPFMPGPAFPGVRALAWGLGAGVFEGLYFLTLAGALTRAPLGWSYTWMRGGSLLLVWPLSLLLLHEPLRAHAVPAVLVVCAGLALMGLVPAGAARRGSLAWAAAVGAAIAGYTLCYKVSLAHGAHPMALYAVSMAVSLPIQLVVRRRREGGAARALLPTQWALTFGAGFLCTASFLLYLQALSLGGAGAMATLRNTSVVFAVVFSWTLGERPTARQWAGACLVAAGAAGVAWRG